MNGELKVSIYREPWNDALSIMIWETRNGKTYRAKHIDLEMEEAPAGVSCGAATLTLDHSSSRSFLKAMAEALDKEGVKTDNDATIAGTLKAQSFHLADLRQLLKLS